MALTTTQLERWLHPLVAAAFPEHKNSAIMTALETALARHQCSNLEDAFFKIDLLLQSIATELNDTPCCQLDLLQFELTERVIRTTLTAYLHHHFARFPEVDHQDAVQQAFLALYAEAPENVRSSPRRLWRYAYTAARNFLLRQDRYYHRFLPEHPHLLISLTTPEDICASRLDWERVQAFVQQSFGTRSYQLFRLWLEGWTLKELAQRFHIATTTLHRRLKDVINAVRDRFSNPS